MLLVRMIFFSPELYSSLSRNHEPGIWKEKKKVMMASPSKQGKGDKWKFTSSGLGDCGGKKGGRREMGVLGKTFKDGGWCFPTSQGGWERGLNESHRACLGIWHGKMKVTPLGHIDRQPEEGCGRAQVSQPGRITRPSWGCKRPAQLSTGRDFCRRNLHPSRSRLLPKWSQSRNKPRLGILQQGTPSGIKDSFLFLNVILGKRRSKDIWKTEHLSKRHQVI